MSVLISSRIDEELHLKLSKILALKGSNFSRFIKEAAEKEIFSFTPEVKAALLAKFDESFNDELNSSSREETVDVKNADLSKEIELLKQENLQLKNKEASKSTPDSKFSSGVCACIQELFTSGKELNTYHVRLAVQPILGYEVDPHDVSNWLLFAERQEKIERVFYEKTLSFKKEKSPNGKDVLVWKYRHGASVPKMK